MRNVRLYGRKPYTVAVVHGGPGAPGEMASVARELSRDYGVLEPLQTRNTLEGQIEELHDVLQEYARLPVKLIGHSWGATLGYILTAYYPALIKKLVLVGSGPFEEKYAGNIPGDRLNRLSEKERIEAIGLIEIINGSAVAIDKDRAIARVNELFVKADTYAPLPSKGSEVIEFSEEINRRVWEGARALRNSGELLELGKKILCPVVAIHGDYDPHLAEGVREPLARVLKDFRFNLLEKCGHEPWMEKYARDKFFNILRKEIE